MSEASLMKTLLAWLLLACPVLTGPTVRVSIDGDGDAAGLAVQAYRSALRDTPGVILVAPGQPVDAFIQMVSVTSRMEGGQKTGYIWAFDVVNSSNVKLYGPVIITVANSSRDIAKMAASSVLDLEKNVFSYLRNIATQPN
jgi:hypothetical protein